MAFDDSKITQTFSDLKMEHLLTRFYMGLAVSSIFVLAIIKTTIASKFGLTIRRVLTVVTESL